MGQKKLTISVPFFCGIGYTMPVCKFILNGGMEYVSISQRNA